MKYRNIFYEYGYSESEIHKKVHDAFRELFWGDEEQRIFQLCGNDMGYMVDTGNHDVRTEGMSYGMMMCVQMDEKELFDRLWKWTVTYMYMDTGIHAGYFAWSCQTNGEKNSNGPAPDGEEYFAMALFFAAARWGDGEGIYAYSEWAKKILSACIHNGESGSGYPMWEAENYLIKFIPECDFTDPSYHLPHFYELFGLWADEMDRDFWKQAALASRQYLKKACHPVTGLSAEYATYKGEPYAGRNKGSERHDWFYSDAYRTIANIALDYAWFPGDDWAAQTASNIQRFFSERQQGKTTGIFLIDGTEVPGEALHPVGLLATLAQASLAAEDKTAQEWVRKFWETPLRQGNRRYYDNCLYFFALLALSGKYRIWRPQEK